MAMRDVAAMAAAERAAAERFEDWLFQKLSGSSAVLSAVVQGSAGWKSARDGLLTSSNFGVIMGVAQHANQAALWQALTGRIEDTFEGNEDTRRGTRVEPRAREWYARNVAQEGEKVAETGLWVNEKEPFLGTSPDALVGDEGLLEIKCPRFEPQQRVKPEYLAQVQGQLNITGRRWCDLLSVTEDGRRSMFRIYRSEKCWAWMVPVLRDFFFAVQMDEMPMREIHNRKEREEYMMALCKIERIF